MGCSLGVMLNKHSYQQSVRALLIKDDARMCTCGTELLPNIPLRMARQRPTITSSLMFSMMPAASPAIRASRIGAEKKKKKDFLMDVLEEQMAYMNGKYISIPHQIIHNSVK